GGRFMEKWGRGNHNVDELYYITRTTMPYGAGGTLSNQQYIDIIAYILKVNGYRAGAGELATDSTLLKQIKIEPQGSPKEKAFTAQSDNEAKTAKPAVDGLLPSSKLPSQEELNAAQSNTTDWLMSNHDYNGQRYVDLKQINRQNVQQLRPACIYQAGDTKTFHNNPVVYRGVMYITTTWSTIALDAINCKVR